LNRVETQSRRRLYLKGLHDGDAIVAALAKLTSVPISLLQREAALQALLQRAQQR